MSSTTGEIYIFGNKNYNQVSHKIAYVPDNPDFNGNFTAFNYLFFIGKCFGIKSSILRSKIHELLDLVGLEKYKYKKMKTYSRGMLQRVGIAQILLNNPDFIILDEPLSYLDPIGQKDIRNTIKRMNNKGSTILVSSHNLSDIEKIADSIVILNKGRVMLNSTIDKILKDEQIYEIEISSNSITDELLDEIKHDFNITIKNKNIIRVEKNLKQDLLKTLLSNEVEILRLEYVKFDLEEVFFSFLN